MLEENKNDILDDTEAEENSETSSNEKSGEDKKSSEKKSSSKRGKEETKKLRDELEAAKKKLEEAERKASEINDKYLRIAAEYDNFRKRSQKEREGVYSDAVADTVMGLVPLIDNLCYADKFGDSDADKFAEGVKLILNSLPETLEKMNVFAFGEAGETFDPNIHNAVMHVDDDAYGEEEIVDVLQRGYRYGDKIIRHAMVKVAN